MVMATKTPQGARLNPQNTLELSQGMSIQVAIDTANAHGGEWTILLYPSVYREGEITQGGGANIVLKSMGPGRTTIAPVAAPATGVIVSGAELILDGIRVINPDLTMPALRVTGGTCNCIDCKFDQVGGAGGNVIEQVAGILTLRDCETDVGAIDLRDAACTLDIASCRINGPIVTAGAFAHHVTVRHCDCNNQAFNLAATGACVYDFESNNEMGTITDDSLGAGAFNGEICRCHVGGAGLHKDGTTGWLIDKSELAAITSTDDTGEIWVYGGIVVVVNATAGIIRLIGTSYREIHRTLTGNIVDQSPWLSDLFWHVQKWSWQVALANSQVAVRGTPRDDGSGQVLLEINTSVADFEAVEALPAVGAYPRTFDPAKTPRMITQYLWNRTGANEFVFIGLRHTPGDAYPVANEDCAGFVYDTVLDPPGTFFAYSIRGANVEYTAIGVPGHTDQIQLEIIIFGGVRVEFYVDGVLVATHTTRVPSDALYWQHLLISDGGEGGPGADVDLSVRNGGVQECPI